MMATVTAGAGAGAGAGVDVDVETATVNEPIRLAHGTSCMAVSTFSNTTHYHHDSAFGEPAPEQLVHLTSILYIWTPSIAAGLGLKDEEQKEQTGDTAVYHGSLVFQTPEKHYYVERTLLPVLREHSGCWELQRAQKKDRKYVVKMRFTFAAAGPGAVHLLNPATVFAHFTENKLMGGYDPISNNCQHFSQDFLRFYLDEAVFDYNVYKQHARHEFSHLTPAGYFAQYVLFPVLNTAVGADDKDDEPTSSFELHYPVVSFKEQDITTECGLFDPEVTPSPLPPATGRSAVG
jgi:hypothetical protein